MIKSNCVQVTFIGGPLDLHRKIMTEGDMDRGLWYVMTPMEQPTQEWMARCDPYSKYAPLGFNRFAYRFYPIPDCRENNKYIGVPA